MSDRVDEFLGDVPWIKNSEEESKKRSASEEKEDKPSKKIKKKKKKEDVLLEVKSKLKARSVSQIDRLKDNKKYDEQMAAAAAAAKV